jgi:hypothetical protein
MRRLVASAIASRVSIEVAAQFAFSATKNPQQPVDKSDISPFSCGKSDRLDRL